MKQLLRFKHRLIGFGLGILIFIIGFSAIANYDFPANVKKEKRRSFLFQYKVEIAKLPETANRIEIWFPLPPDNLYQTVTDIAIHGQTEYRVVQDPEYGNKIAYISATAESGRPFETELTFRVTRKQRFQLYSSERDFTLAQPRNLRRFLAPDSLVPIGGKIAAATAEVINSRMTPLQEARAIYDYVVATMSYDKTGQGWGRGDAVYACDARKGNCTDFHSLFIGMARAAGIPARFVIGFPIPEKRPSGKINGYHCWAEFFLPDAGWIPVDASEARQHPRLKKFLFGGLDANRVEFTIGRDIRLDSRRNLRLNYFIYPYVLVDGKQFTAVTREFSFRDLEPAL